MTLAGLLEIADREFQGIETDDRRLREEARRSVAEGRLDQVEITPDALKAYLDKRLGSDGRMSDWSYSYTARLLHELGFIDLNEVDAPIRGYDDDKISRLLWGSRQGQLTRFEEVLLAALGEEFIRAHPWAGKSIEYKEKLLNQLRQIREANIEVGTYRLPIRDTRAQAN